MENKSVQFVGKNLIWLPPSPTICIAIFLENFTVTSAITIVISKVNWKPTKSRTEKIHHISACTPNAVDGSNARVNSPYMWSHIVSYGMTVENVTENNRLLFSCGVLGIHDSVIGVQNSASQEIVQY